MRSWFNVSMLGDCLGCAAVAEEGVGFRGTGSMVVDSVDSRFIVTSVDCIGLGYRSGNRGGGMSTVDRAELVSTSEGERDNRI